MCGICAMCWICVGYVWWIRLKWICVGYVKCAGYVWDMCGVRYANNLLKNPATKRLSGKNKQTAQNQHTHFFLVRQKMEIKVVFTFIHHSSRIYLPKDRGSAKAHRPHLQQRFQPPKDENCAVRSITTSGPFSRKCHQFYATTSVTKSYL